MYSEIKHKEVVDHLVSENNVQRPVNINEDRCLFVFWNSLKNFRVL